MTPLHTHHKVLIALANGEQLQFRQKNSPSWFKYTPEGSHVTITRSLMLGSTEYEWRIAPPIRTEWVAIGSADSTVCLKEDSAEQAIARFKVDHGVPPLACIKVTYTDGEGV